MASSLLLESLVSGRILFHLDACAHDAVFHSIIVSTEGNPRKTIQRYRHLESNDVSPKAVAILNQQNVERKRSKLKVVGGKK
jgi:hypothetical protein